VKRQVPADSEARAKIVGLQQELIQIGTDIRHISHELHPALLQEAGPPSALTAYCDGFTRERGLPVSCETDESVVIASRRKHSGMPQSIPRQRKLKFGRERTVGFAFPYPMMALLAIPTRPGNREGWG
jgi:hypothetical protein